MAVIGTVLAAMTPTLKAVALQVALNVGMEQASKIIGKDNADVAGQAVQAFAGGDVDGLVDIGTNFATDQINNFANNHQMGEIGQIATEGIQQVMGAGQGNRGQALQDFGVDQTTQYLNQLMGKADLSQFPNIQRLSQSPEGQTLMSETFGTMQQQGGMAGLAGKVGSMWQEATRPPAHLDPNNIPAERQYLPRHNESLLQSIDVFGRPAPAPTARLNKMEQPMVTPNPYSEDNLPLVNGGRYRV